jgi:hypothetical protein
LFLFCIFIIFILICLECTPVRITATRWQLNCSK